MQMLRVLWANRSQTAGRGGGMKEAEPGTGAGAGNHKQDGSPGCRLPNGFWCAKVKVKCAKSDATRADSCHRGEARVTGREGRWRGTVVGQTSLHMRMPHDVCVIFRIQCKPCNMQYATLCSHTSVRVHWATSTSATLVQPPCNPLQLRLSNLM